MVTGASGSVFLISLCLSGKRCSCSGRVRDHQSAFCQPVELKCPFSVSKAPDDNRISEKIGKVGVPVLLS